VKLKHFSIRDLLWLTLVVALVVGWWIDAVRRERKHFEETYQLRYQAFLYKTGPIPSTIRTEGAAK
jgi:hypothetical protein